MGDRSDPTNEETEVAGTGKARKRTFEDRHHSYLKYKREHPEASYAQYIASLNLKEIAAGEEKAQLGPNLRGWDDWWKAGEAKVQTYRRRFRITPASRIVDYGCGTLRIGGHFIKYLEPGGYFGMDVVAEYLDIGRNLVGAALVSEKRPRLGVIDEPTVAEAVAFQPDFVCSISVCTHVHPDEAGIYFANLSRLASKPGAVLFFSAVLAERPSPQRAFALPLSGYQAALPELQFVKCYGGQARNDHGFTIATAMLEFRRPAL